MSEQSNPGIQDEAVEVSNVSESAASGGPEEPTEASKPTGRSSEGSDRAFRPPRKSPSTGAMVREEESGQSHFTASQRLLILDAWQRSELAATDFSPLVGVTPTTLYSWRQRFRKYGPAGLSDSPRKTRGVSKLPETTQRAIIMLKEAHPEWGVDRIHDVLWRSEGYTASAGSILRVLKQAGWMVEEEPTRPHPPQEKRFERAKPNQLWQSDLFTFVLKRQNRRVHLVAFLDDHSRFIVGYGLHASASGAMVREVLEAAIANYGAPEEVLTDQGPQYHTWRGKSAFTKLLQKRGIRHILARAKRPQTLGKTERFWGSLWRECLETAIFRDLEEARTRIGHFIDYYNFQRPHQGIEGMMPADRYFEAVPEVRKAVEERVARNAAQLARDGVPRKGFYLTGKVGEEGIALHGEGGRVILTREGGGREEVDLQVTGRRAQPGEPSELPEPSTPPPGSSPLDEAMQDLQEGLEGAELDGKSRSEA